MRKPHPRAFFLAMFAAILLILMANLFPASAEHPPQENSPVVTQQEARIAGKVLKYTAETGRTAIRDVETGEPHGFMFYTAYRIAPQGMPRPLTFVWNGGPGADSALLHFSAVGPKLLQGDHLVDNPDSWLAVTDLVLVDPIGTGFSRPAKAEYGAEFYGTLGDVASVTEFIRAWRLEHGALFATGRGF
jgi:carboxypeptidase C (cathepsin A)